MLNVAILTPLPKVSSLRQRRARSRAVALLVTVVGFEDVCRVAIALVRFHVLQSKHLEDVALRLAGEALLRRAEGTAKKRIISAGSNSRMQRQQRNRMHAAGCAPSGQQCCYSRELVGPSVGTHLFLRSAWWE